jgi:hypothetical protein
MNRPNDMVGPDVTAIDLNGMPARHRRDRLSELCPRCHHNQQPKVLEWQWIPEVRELHGVFRCTNALCERVFIAEYEQNLREIAYLVEEQIADRAGVKLQSRSPVRRLARRAPARRR